MQLAQLVETGTSAAERIAHLKRLRKKWTTELEQVLGMNHDQAFHLAEALDDLKTFIRHLESGFRPED